ncbi:MAG: DUF6765 family protein [Burkholderiaceae bacterium]
MHPRPRGPFRRRWRQALVSLMLCLPVAALACGAQGGDEREPKKQLICDPNAPVASHPATDPPVATGNPIDPITGNKYLLQRDAVWAGGLVLARHYNSRNDFPSSLGPGWRHGFEVVLAIHKRGKRRRAQIIQGDGRRIVFEAAAKSPAGGRHLRALEPGYGQLRHRPDGPPDRQYEWRWRDGTRLSFDHLGRMSAAAHADGRRFTLHYGKRRCQLLRVSTPSGDSLSFAYRGDDCRVAAVTMPDRQRIVYRYDAQGVLTTVLANDRLRWRFEYDDAHRAALVRVIDAQGKVRGEFAYEPQGRAVASALENGRDAITVDYRLPSEPGGIGESHIRDAVGRQTRLRWRLDVRSQVRQALSVVGERCVACPPVGRSWRYDSAGRLLQSTQSDGDISVDLRRDALGRIIGRTVRTGARARHWWFGYDTSDGFDRLRSIETDSINPDARHRLDLHYDTFDRLIAVDETGWQPDLASVEPVGNQWRFKRFTKLHRRRSIVYGTRGPAADRIIEMAVNGQRLASYRYDARGALAASTDATGLQWRYQHDAFGRLTGIERPDGSRWQAHWHEAGVRITDHGVVTDLGLAPDGLVASVRPSNAPGLGFERDPNGLITAITSDDGHRIDLAVGAAFLRPAAGGIRAGAVPPRDPRRKTSSTPPRNAIITIERPDLGERAFWVVDDFGRKIAQIDAAIGVRRWAYDARDQVVARVDSRGNAHRIDRDAAGRVLRIEDSRARPLVVFTYGAGRPTSRTDSVQAEQNEYDDTGRLASRNITLRDPASGQRVGPVRLAYRVDPRGRLAERSLHDGFALRYRWHDDNTLAGIDLIEPGGATSVLVTDCRWLPFSGGANGLLAARFGNGTQLLRRIDSQLRTLAVRHVPAPGSSDALPIVSRRIDAAGLTSAWSDGSEWHALRYDDKGQLIADGASRWTYQRDGTPHTRGSNPTLASGARFWFDRAAMLRVALGASGRPVRYLHNAAGERVAKIRPGRPQDTQWFINEGRRPSMMLDANGNLRRVFITLDHLPVAVIDITGRQARVSWIHADYRGLPRALSDQHGAMRWSGEYGAYGDLTAARWHGQPMQGFGVDSDHGLPSPVPMRLPGQYHDAETGLHHNDLRNFDPRAARYLTPDPLGLRPTGLRYAYAENQPYDRADPLGLYEIDIHYYMTYFIARTAGIEHEAAYRIALAAQGIDDNVLTQPININEQGEPDYLASVATNQDRLLAYHFVLSERQTDYLSPTAYALMQGTYSLVGLPPPLTVPGPNGTVGIQTIRNPPASTPLSNPNSPQLERLMSAALANDDPCARAHLLGEFVHAFQDTFSHRDESNRPYSPTDPILNLGVGHGADMHDPDWTFNHTNRQWFEAVPAPSGVAWVPHIDTPDGQARINYSDWNVNEDRTLQMERDLHALLSRFGDANQAVPFEMIEDVLRDFNATREWDREGINHAESFPGKLSILEGELEALGYQVDSSTVRFLSGPNGEPATAQYNRQRAIDNRNSALCGGDLPTGVIAASCN